MKKEKYMIKSTEYGGHDILYIRSSKKNWINQSPSFSHEEKYLYLTHKF